MQINDQALIKLLSNKSFVSDLIFPPKRRLVMISYSHDCSTKQSLELLFSLCIHNASKISRCLRSPTPTLLPVLNTSVRTLQASLPAVASPCIGLLGWRRRAQSPPLKQKNDLGGCSAYRRVERLFGKAKSVQYIAIAIELKSP